MSSSVSLSRRRSKQVHVPYVAPSKDDVDVGEEAKDNLKKDYLSPVDNRRKRDSRSPLSDDDFTPHGRPPKRRAARRRGQAFNGLDLDNCNLNDGGPSNRKNLRRLPSRLSHPLYTSTEEDSENSAKVTKTETEPTTVKMQPIVALRRMSVIRASSQPALSELQQANKSVDNRAEKLNKTFHQIQEKESADGERHGMSMDFASAESELDENVGDRPKTPLQNAKPGATSRNVGEGLQTPPQNAKVKASDGNVGDRLLRTPPQNAKDQDDAFALDENTIIEVDSPTHASVPPVSLNPQIPICSFLSLRDLKKEPYNAAGATSTPNVDKLHIADYSVDLFASVMEEQEPEPTTVTVYKSLNRNEESNESGISMEAEVTNPRNDFTIEGLFNWLLPKAAKTKASSQHLLADILQRENIFLILDQRYREMLDNPYLMEKYTTEELFRSLVHGLKSIVEGELTEITSSYHDVLGILN